MEEVLRASGAFAPSTADHREPEVISALRRVSEAASTALTARRAELAELEPALGITLKKTAEHVRSSIGKVIDKATRVHQNRAGKGARQVRRVNHTLMPRGVPPERILGPFQFIARFGPDFLDALWREIPSTATEHLVLHLRTTQETHNDLARRAVIAAHPDDAEISAGGTILRLVDAGARVGVWT